jgi:hypothetical protein
MSNKSGTTSSAVISLPKGGGALHGIGEKCSPDGCTAARCGDATTSFPNQLASRAPAHPRVRVSWALLDRNRCGCRLMLYGAPDASPALQYTRSVGCADVDSSVKTVPRKEAENEAT